MFTADEKIKKASTIRNDCKIMVLSAEDLISKEAHYHTTCYRSNTSINYNKDNDEGRIQEEAENHNQQAFEFVKPGITFLITISDLYAEKIKHNQAENVRVFCLKKNLRRKLMTHLTGFNYTEANRRYVVYPETLETEDLIHKHLHLQKEFDAVMKCNVSKVSGYLMNRGNYCTKRNSMATQASHHTVESFKIPERLNCFLQKLLRGKYTDTDSPRVSCLILSFSQDLIYATTSGKIETPKSILFPYAIKSLQIVLNLSTSHTNMAMEYHPQFWKS